MILLVATHFTRTTKVTAISGDIKRNIMIDSMEDVIQVINSEIEIENDPVTDVVFTGNETKVSRIIKEYFSEKGVVI
jgi:hypothetical protein